MQSLISLERSDIAKLSNFRASDDAYTAPIHGFLSADDYYHRSSARQFLKGIETPTLIIQALDDPFMTEEILPDISELPDAVTLEVYPHGGHVGFVSGNLLQPEYWLEGRGVDFFEAINSRLRRQPGNDL
jgi:predicted alpha/beta-fold hydrolase